MEIKISNLQKVYNNGHRALNNVELEISNGMFGLLGPNGAGKSTLMRILVTLLQPSAGKVLIDGKDLQRNRREIRTCLGYLPQEFRFFAKLKTWEFLEYAASLAGIKSSKERKIQVEAMLEKVGLYEARNRFANKLSGGMKRRLGIAQAIIGDPRLIIVDEPTTGLDPEERIRFRNILSDLSRREVVIILSTHIVGDISSTCGQMALLNNGTIGFNGHPEAFINLSKGHVFKLQVGFDEIKKVNELYPVISSIPTQSGFEVEVVADRLNGFEGRAIPPNLEHAYVYYMEYLAQKN